MVSFPTSASSTSFSTWVPSRFSTFSARFPLLPLTGCFVAGIVVGDRLPAALPVLTIALSVMVAVSLLLYRRPYMQSLTVIASFGFLGMLLIQRQQARLAASWPEGRVSYEAVVLSAPVEKPKSVAVDIQMTTSGRKLKCYLQADDRSRSLHVGNGLHIRSVIRPADDWHIGTFDYRRYLETRGFTGTTFVTARNWTTASVPLDGLSLTDRARLRFLTLREQLLQRFRHHGATSEPYAVVAAMTLGDKSALTRELRDVYAVSGASHILALSGLHLGIIYALLSLLVVGRRWQTVSRILLITSIWAFVFLVGMSASVVRAAVMLSVHALLSSGHRDQTSVNTLAFTALLMLIVSPLSLFDVGFQLSFASVFAILTCLPLADCILPPAYLQSHRVVRWFWSMLVISLAAQLGTAPLIAYYFGRLPVYFLLTNLVVVPAATLILYLSLLVLIAPVLTPWLTSAVSLLNSFLSRLASLPHASIEGLHPTPLQVCAVYVLIASIGLLTYRMLTIRRKRV